jgi:hypothetical protein
MIGSARMLAASAVLLISAAPVLAQVNYRATPPPVVTAENEPWYLAGQPVMYAGTIYYPTGPQVHFNGNEMVRSGFFHGTPLYTRTTIEPYSMVFVPLAGGLMQPYERRRDGEVAGTVGSTVPSFPVVRSSEPDAYWSGIRQAAAPPGNVMPPELPADEPATERGAVGTVGPIPMPAPAVAPPTRHQARGNEGLFIEFGGHRWFGTGKVLALDKSRLTRAGEHHGFPVYTDPRDPGSIFVPVSSKLGEFVARYSRRSSR